MNWLLTIPTRSFDIVRAFTIGNIVEYRQTDNFRVGDDVFIVLASEEVSYQVKYVCKVEKINIDVEDSQYYHHYVNEDGELELIDFLMQLKLIQTIPDENSEEYKIKNLGLGYLPSKPIRAIGENRVYFDKLDELIKKLNQSENETIDYAHSIYMSNRESFLSVFPKDSWSKVQVNDYLENSHLFINEFNESIEKLTLVGFEKNNGEYITSLSTISNIEDFFTDFRNDIQHLLDNKQTKLLSLFPELAITLVSYYENSTLLLNDQYHMVCKLMGIKAEDPIQGNKEISAIIRKSNPNIDFDNGYVLTQFVLNKFELLKIKSEQNDLAQKDEYFNNDDIQLIKRLLNRHKKIIITHLSHFGGKESIKRIIDKIAIDNIEGTNQFTYFYYYELIKDTQIYESQLNELLTDSENRFNIIYSLRSKPEIETTIYRRLLTKFIEFHPGLSLIDSDVISFLKVMDDKVKVEDFRNIINEINTIIGRNSDEPCYITRDVFLKKEISDIDDILDFISYKIKPLILSNKLDKSINEKCLGILENWIKGIA